MNESFARLVGDDLIFGATDEESAVLVDDYPYGYTQRTQIRYWLETTKNGDRFCSQTLNPKTGRWNKPKKSTYSDVGMMYRYENGHVKWTGVHTWSDEEFLSRFVELVGDHLTLAQRNKLARIKGVRKAFEGVTYEIVETTHWTPEQRAEADAKQKEAEAVIAKRAAVETFHAKTELAREFGVIR